LIYCALHILRRQPAALRSEKSGIFYAKSYAFATQNVPFGLSKRMLSWREKCLFCIIITPKRKQMLTKQHPTPCPFNFH
jgi:hypothetical protein